MQTISTRYIGPSNTRGSRIIATTSGGIRKVYPYQHDMDIDGNHTGAAWRLAESLGWHGNWQGGHTERGMVFVLVDGTFSPDYRFDVANAAKDSTP